MQPKITTEVDSIPFTDIKYVRLIGEGAFGKVWEITDPLGRQFAMKKLNENQSFEQALEEFLTHRDFSDHPNIVKLLCFYVNQFPRLAVGIQELVRGGCLFDYVKKKRFSKPVSRVLICQTVTAIEYIHSRNYVHRDLKTENLLVDGPLDPVDFASWVKITDFGMAVPFRKQNTQGQWTEIMFTGVVGTLPYAAPEMFSGLPYRGPPAEMFALGVLLFVIVMGTLPFKKANENEDQLFALLQKDDTDEFWEAHRGYFKYKKNVATKEFRTIIKALLTKDLSQRLSLDDFIKHPWMAEKYASEEQVRKSIMKRRATWTKIDQIVSDQPATNT